MRKATVVAVTLLLLGLAAALSASTKDNPTGRLLTGRVVDQQENALSGAIVYLTNTRTRAVKTYIVGKDGQYRFPSLSLNTDYELYAQYNGRKSDSKTVSQFDSRATVNINLRIDAK
ncbi:MAG TPA: carboxypeptidase-like regulatory domain-containing protein [Terriglobales bacterium]|nr:carboxypeptidase-like regulatory domain-containing protein [Terriglobales bacterium]